MKNTLLVIVVLLLGWFILSGISPLKVAGSAKDNQRGEEFLKADPPKNKATVPKKVTNLSKVFASELADAKKLNKKAVMINALIIIHASGFLNTTMIRSQYLVSSVLNTKEFKDFADNNASIHIVNIQPVLTPLDMDDINKQSRDPGKVKEILFKLWGGTKELKRVTDGNPRNGEITGRGVYSDEARRALMKQKREKISTLWKAFKGKYPASMLLDSEGNVLNMKMYGGSRFAPHFVAKPEDYINEYYEILKPISESKNPR